MYNVPTPVASSRVHKHPSPPPFSFTPSHTPPPSLPSMSPPRSFAPLPLPPAPHSALKSQIVRNAQSHNYARARVHAHQQPPLVPRHPSEAADIPPRPHLHPRPHPHPSHPAAQARARALQCRLEAAHAALLADLEVIGDDEARRRLRIEAHNDLVYRWSWEWEVNPGPGGLGGGARL